ncbi:hypothetical protein J2Y90_003158 [Pseudomonas koreensis]|nr:hypothetical protein [Pseudomonas koreensis]
MHTNFVELAWHTAGPCGFALSVEFDLADRTTVHGHDFDFDIADWNVVNRFEFALDQQRPFERALSHVRSEVTVGHAHRFAGVAHLDDTFHAQQRRHVSGMATFV